MDWREAISKTAGYLGSHGVPDSETAAELLAARLIKTKRSALLGRLLDSEVPPRCIEALRRAMARLKAGEPLQYVLGEWDFRRLTLKCDPRALIPRPETEGLVSLVLEHIGKTKFKSTPFIVDVGTGTGAIALSIADEANIPAIILGTDASEDALSLARENAALTGLTDKVRFAIADGLDDFDEPESIDIIVSNPPYVTSAEYAALDPRVKDFEPRMALESGPDGLEFCERYLADALNLLKSGGRVFFEIGDTQGDRMMHLMTSFGFLEPRIFKDLAGLDRYATASLP
ncbi:MAG: peptide chain release factor N(5)-glutamine methyltransferase [Kiritimatiellae bacterium]|nr:peptide chain release factor N(5)-glutamine methyltransferase [Kiritimatiellia bacterium]